MTAEPVAIITPRTPLLEAVAEAILRGATEESGTTPLPILTDDSIGSLPSVATAPLVFLGWRGDLAGSRRLAGRALSMLTQPSSNLRHIALFETSLRAPTSRPNGSRAEAGSVARSNVRRLGSAARFVLDRDPAEDSDGLLELARARRWGAETYSEWRATLRRSPVDERPEDTTPLSPRPVFWCGGME